MLLYNLGDALSCRCTASVRHDYGLIDGIDFVDSINRGDVGMIRRRRTFRLNFKALAFLGVGRDVVRKKFDRDEAIELCGLGFLPVR